MSDDAEATLDKLRKTIIDNLNGGFVEHTKMSNEVDNAAFETKESGLKILKQKITKCLKNVNDLEKCVNDEADKAIDIIFNNSSEETVDVLNLIYENEKNIVHCGRADDDCLNNVIEAINAAIESIPSLLDQSIEKDRQAVEAQIEVIKACASKMQTIC